MAQAPASTDTAVVASAGTDSAGSDTKTATSGVESLPTHEAQTPSGSGSADPADAAVPRSDPYNFRPMPPDAVETAAPLAPAPTLDGEPEPALSPPPEPERTIVAGDEPNPSAASPAPAPARMPGEAAPSEVGHAASEHAPAVVHPSGPPEPTRSLRGARSDRDYALEGAPVGVDGPQLDRLPARPHVIPASSPSWPTRAPTAAGSAPLPLVFERLALVLAPFLGELVGAGPGPATGAPAPAAQPAPRKPARSTGEVSSQVTQAGDDAPVHGPLALATRTPGSATGAGVAPSVFAILLLLVVLAPRPRHALFRAVATREPAPAFLALLRHPG